RPSRPRAVRLALSADMPAMLPREIEPLARAAGVTADPRSTAEWLLSPAADSLAARRYVFFLKWMYETFHAVEECFPDAGQEGLPTRGTSAVELLYLANRLYVLDSFGGSGAVLEAGAFAGVSI